MKNWYFYKGRQKPTSVSSVKRHSEPNTRRRGLSTENRKLSNAYPTGADPNNGTCLPYFYFPFITMDY